MASWESRRLAAFSRIALKVVPRAEAILVMVDDPGRSRLPLAIAR